MGELAIPQDMQRQAHETLVSGFTNRYIGSLGSMGKILHSVPYDPNNELCDYNRTWWPSRPNRLSQPVGQAVLGKLHHMSRKEMDEIFVAPMAERAPVITSGLRDFPVMLINGHTPDLQAALSLFTGCQGIARANPDHHYQRNLMDMIRIAHGIATRGLVPIRVGKAGPRSPGVNFLDLERLVVSPHHTVPVNGRMIRSGMPKDFMRRYNSVLKDESIQVAHTPTDHPDGYHSFWSLSPTATRDEPGQGEHEGKMIIQEIIPATVDLVRAMGCGLVHVRTSFGKGKRPSAMDLGPLILPDQVTDQTMHDMMADGAEFRRQHGEPNVVYAGELS